MMYNVTYLGRPVYGTDEENCILEPKLDEELNSAGTFTFTVPVENESLWNSIEVFNGEVIIYEEDDVIWFGRPFQIVRDWLNRKVVTCEGALAYFNDTVQATHTYDGLPLYTEDGVQNGKKGFFNTIIDLHNDMVQMDDATDFSRQIFVGDITVDNESNIYREVDYQTTSEVLQQMCLDTNGGYFILRKAMDPSDGYVKTYIDWVKDMPYGTTQNITFGRNLLDVNQDLNGSDICTVLLAFGSDDKTIAGLNKWTSENDPYSCKDGTDIYHKGKDSEYLIDIQGYKKYGRVLKVKTWNDIVANDASGKEQLFIKAAKWLNDQNEDITTIECNAADLHYIDTDDVADQGKLRIGQKVTVLSPIHDLNAKELPIFKISMSLDSGAKTITMGTPPKRELTDIVKSSGGSTRGSSGTTGGGGGSDGSGGGSSSVNIPVKDVQVKFPGDEKFGTVVKKKIAKIDLSEVVGGVTDVKLDNVSKVTSGVANINTSDIVTANPEGQSVGNLSSIKIGQDKYNIPAVSNVVEDVTLDGVSIKDPNDNVAKILSRDIIEEVEGNFEHVVHEFVDDEEPSSSVGKTTDMLVGYSEYESSKSIINSTNYADYSTTPITQSSYVKWTQDFIMQPTGYYDPNDLDEHGNPKWKYDPNIPTRFYSTHTFDGNDEGTNVFYANVPGVYTPFTGHAISTGMRGTALNYTSGDIDFVYHENGKKYKPTNISGYFYTVGIDDLESVGIGPKQEVNMGVSSVSVFVSKDGTNWTRLNNVHESGDPEQGQYSSDFECDDYYEYVKLSFHAITYVYLGWSDFNLYAEPFYEFDTIWYKHSDYSWRRLKKIPVISANTGGTASETLNNIEIDGVLYDILGSVSDVQIDGTSIVDVHGVADIDSSLFGTDVEANPTGQSVGYLTAIRIENSIYDIPTGGGGGGTVVRYNIVTKSTGGWDAAITINKYVNGTLESSVDYLYTSLQSQDVDIDGCFTINYGISAAYSYTIRLTKSSTTNPAGYSYSWQYNQSVDFDQTFVKQIVYVDDLYDACVANHITPASRTLTDIIAAILGN